MYAILAYKPKQLPKGSECVSGAGATFVHLQKKGFGQVTFSDNYFVSKTIKMYARRDLLDYYLVPWKALL